MSWMILKSSRCIQARPDAVHINLCGLSGVPSAVAHNIGSERFPGLARTMGLGNRNSS
jgi:hypothetical protein